MVGVDLSQGERLRRSAFISVAFRENVIRLVHDDAQAGKQTVLQFLQKEHFPTLFDKISGSICCLAENFGRSEKW